MPSPADIQAWLDGPEAAGNVALRLPHGVYGLDVDAYGSKGGAGALARLERELGPLPKTWRVTSRKDGVSGIRLFCAELPPGRRWKDEPAGHGAGIEAIHFGHRYAVAWPSVHPDTGEVYVAYSAYGEVHAAAFTPDTDDLPELSYRWVMALSEPGEHLTGVPVEQAEAAETVNGFREGEECRPVRLARERAARRLEEAHDGAALHPAGRDAVHELTHLGHEGHRGVLEAMQWHRQAFIAARLERGDGRGDAEWWRLLRDDIGKLSGEQEDECDCALWTGEGLLFDPPLAPPGGLRNELLSADEMASRPRPRPLVRGWLNLDSSAWIIGKSGSYKSFIVLDLALRVAHGWKWADAETAMGPVLYVAAEGAGGMGLRLQAWRKAHGALPTQVHFLPRPVQAKSLDGWDELVRLAADLKPVLIVIDTQARVTLGIQENDNTEMSGFVEQVDRLRRACGACVLVVHHIGRSGTDARGASALDGAQDTELRVNRHESGGQLSIDKQKDGRDDLLRDFVMREVDLGRDDETGEHVQSLVVDWDAFVSATRREITHVPPPIPPGGSHSQDTMERRELIVRVLEQWYGGTGGTVTQVARTIAAEGLAEARSRESYRPAWLALWEDRRIMPIKGSRHAFRLTTPAERAELIAERESRLAESEE